MLVKVFVDPKETKGDLVHIFFTLSLFLIIPVKMPTIPYEKSQPSP